MTTSSVLISQASQWLHNLNPTLPKIPPRADNVDEICLLSPSGSTEGAILCRDLPYSQATCVGSWLLPSEHHFVEGIVVTLLSLLILIRTFPKLYQITDSTQLHIQHPWGSKAVSLFCFAMMMVYKYSGYPGRVWYIVMPCNMQWALSFLQCWVVPEHWSMAQYTLLQMRLTYIMSVIIAIVTPETDDCLLPGEFAFYWFNHVLLLILPIAYIANGSVSCLPHTQQRPGLSEQANNTTSKTNSTTTKGDHYSPSPRSTVKESTTISTWAFNGLWWQFSCAIFSVFYFIPVTLLAIYSGLNLNFMLHPPHDHFILKGRWFRLMAVTLLAILFGVSRALMLWLETSVLRNDGGTGSVEGVVSRKKMKKQL
jgi:hypothetical protein